MAFRKSMGIALCIALIWSSVAPSALAQQPSGTSTQPSGEAQAAQGAPPSPTPQPPSEAKPPAPEAKPPEAKPEAKEAVEEGARKPAPPEAVSVPKRFGFDFFLPARRRILQLEKMLAEGGLIQQAAGTAPSPSAISGIVGPMEMTALNVYATVPPKYIIGPGDKITIYYWSDVLDLQVLSIVVDENGEVILPRIGRITVRGMTLPQFEDAARSAMERTIKNLRLVATLDKLRSIQIFITGEAFRPGSYAVSAVTTLFNALYACGGPNDNGSLRDIRLLRAGKTTRIDFYKYLMEGDSSQDYELLPGDTIFIAPTGRLVEVRGEVRRPAIYELKDGERLRDLIQLANGIRSTGLAQRIQIESVRPSPERGMERVVVDVDATKGDPTSNPDLLDGDVVTVFSILPERMNTVTLEGKVERPGTYELKPGMRIADLFLPPNKLLGEAYLDRADLFRLNPDMRTTTLIPIDLGKALQGDPQHNIPLQRWDRLVVYSKWDVRWIAPRVVTVVGAVGKPGGYERTDGLKLSDLILQAGGLLPEASPPPEERAKGARAQGLILRMNERWEVAQAIPVDLDGALQGDPKSNVEMRDGDTLIVYKWEEIRWRPKREVMISGAVQRPGAYPRTDGLKLSDLILQAGGLMPNAYMKRAEVVRLLPPDYEKAIVIPVELGKAIAGDPSSNLSLEDRDVVRIYTVKEAEYWPDRVVSIYGAVQRPDTYVRGEGMKLSDLIFMAGGLLPGAAPKAEIAKARCEKMTTVLTVDLDSLSKGDRSQDVALEDGDVVMIRKRSDFFDKPMMVRVEGEVKLPGTYALRTKNDRVSDVIKRAGGLTEYAYPEGAMIIRDVKKLLSDDQRKGIETIRDLIDRLNELEYERELARSQWLKEVQVKPTQEGYAPTTPAAAQPSASVQVPQTTVVAPTTGEAVTAGVAGALPGLAAQAAAGAVSAVAGPAAPSVVSRARKITDLLPTGKIVIDLREALSGRGGPKDIVLEEGDLIFVPKRPTHVLVTGAVMNPSAVAYLYGKDLEYYISEVGGFAIDADTKNIFVVRMNGEVLRVSGKKNVEVMAGDTIFVPTKVMVREVVDRWDRIIGVVRFMTVTIASTIAVIYAVKILAGK
jgi:protein involved in polysaccharide export with SLBB domain